jgi:hypothetical protein
LSVGGLVGRGGTCDAGADGVAGVAGWRGVGALELEFEGC